MPEERSTTEATGDTTSVVAVAKSMLDAFEVFDTLWRIEWGLSGTEKVVITHLWTQQSASMTDLAARVGMTSGGVTSLIDRLERDGYVSRVSDPSDRRRQLVSLTEQGAACRAELQRTLEVAIDHVGASAAEPVLDAFRAHFHAGADVIRRRLQQAATNDSPTAARATD
jgi:DNA-binding MarR family transcriptional regulator